MRGVASAIEDARRLARSTLLCRPLGFRALSRDRRGLVRVDTHSEMVIDGFERCGNTFAVTAFEMAQMRPVRIAHHTHSSGQVLTAVKQGIPCLLTIRRPRDAAVSFGQYYPAVSMTTALLSYIVLYGNCLPAKEHLVVGHFEDVTTDMGSVIERVNGLYHTAFKPFDSSPENIRRCFELIDRSVNVDDRQAPFGLVVPRPSETRRRQRPLVEARYDSSPSALRRLAESIYQEYCD